MFREKTVISSSIFKRTEKKSKHLASWKANVKLCRKCPGQHTGVCSLGRERQLIYKAYKSQTYADTICDLTQPYFLSPWCCIFSQNAILSQGPARNGKGSDVQRRCFEKTLFFSTFFLCHCDWLLRFHSPEF